MMKVELLNKEEVLTLFKDWGTAACMCYDTPAKYAERVGKSCLTTKHFSGSRGNYIKFKITGVPRALVDQLVRHEQGVFKNVESGRYVNFSDFDYYIPKIVEKDKELSELYHSHMERTRQTYKDMVQRLETLGYKGEKAFEVARGVAPMNYNTGLVIGFTVEALINLMNKRLCVCSQDHIRQLAKLMKKEVVEVLPELEKYLVPVCEAYTWCPENPKRSCGKYPQKEEVLKLIIEHKNRKDK